MCIIMGLEVVQVDAEPIGEPVHWQEAAAAAPADSASTPAKGDGPAADSPTANTDGASRTGAAPFAGTPPAAPQGLRPQGFKNTPPADLSNARPIPIEALNPYNNRWTIKARVISKSDLRSYNSSKMGDGKFFSFDICDESGEMRVMAWREAADRYYNLVEPGKVRQQPPGRPPRPRRPAADPLHAPHAPCRCT